MVRHNLDLAELGVPYNAEPIPVFRPKLPRAEKLLPYLGEIDHARCYSNRGRLVQALEQRLSAMFAIDQGVIVTASGSAALQAAILAAAGPASLERPLALMPSYTFVATASAAERCGYEPYFLDIEKTDWIICPKKLAGHAALDRAGVVIPVASYGRGVAQEPWRSFREVTGVPVVIDGAAAFEAILSDPAGLVGDVPVALSFHATKTFSTGEGGAVVWRDVAGLLTVVSATNFGFLGTRESISPSFNGRMSEYHAAVGHASLDEWDESHSAWRITYMMYKDLATGLSDRLILPPKVASCYALFRARSKAEAVAVTSALTAQGMEHRYWYGYGLHTQLHFASAPRDNLPVTNRIARHLIGLPIAVDLPLKATERIVATLSKAVDNVLQDTYRPS